MTPAGPGAGARIRLAGIGLAGAELCLNRAGGKRDRQGNRRRLPSSTLSSGGNDTVGLDVAKQIVNADDGRFRIQ